MAESLFSRYMAAYKAAVAHRAACSGCRITHDDLVLCETGARLDDEFVRLQDAYRRSQTERG